jgi:preprotein translocase subunit SecG
VLVVLLQRSEGSGLTASDAQSFGARRAAAHPLARLTAVLATLFMITSLTLTIIGQRASKPSSILDAVPAAESSLPAKTPANSPTPSPAAENSVDKPAAPAQPTVPVTK